METFFKKFCLKIMNALDSENNCNELERLQMYFALQTIAYNFSVTFFILFLSYIIGSFGETFLLFCTFGILRIIAGGFHFNSILKCIIVTSIIMIGEGKLAQYIQINLPACLLICLFTDIVLFFHIPKGTSKNPYSEEYSQLQQKRLKVIALIFSLTAILFIKVRTIILFAMLTVTILLLPNLLHRFQETE